MKEINTHNLIIDFGKHKGERWTRVPVSYLRWILNEMNPEDEKYKIAKAEIDRRGTVLEKDIEISDHALDKASLRVRRIWHKTALNNDEGLLSWLRRVSKEALADGETIALSPDGKTVKIMYSGIKFVFQNGNIYPVLKTVIYRNKFKDEEKGPEEIERRINSILSNSQSKGVKIKQFASLVRSLTREGK